MTDRAADVEACAGNFCGLRGRWANFWPIRSAFDKALLPACVFLTASALFRPCDAGTDPARELYYQAHHPIFGNIGSYTNTIMPAGDATTIRTSVHIKVTALGAVLHSEDAERTENWKGGRLVHFSGMTTTNGEVLKIKGDAQDGAFVITTPRGSATAPATIQPSNPWSASLLTSTKMMRADTGEIEDVRTSGGEVAFVEIDGANVWTRRYQIHGTIGYKVWIDRQNIPVMFSVDDEGGAVLFTLKTK